MLINKLDNVEINTENGHKYAVRKILSGEKIIKYGFPIGIATADIEKDEHVHSHNMKTALSGKLEYLYERYSKREILPSARKFMGYRRENGDVGIRNDIWIVKTVGCVSKIGERLSKITGAKAFSHPFGCSQLGGDMEITQKILKPAK